MDNNLENKNNDVMRLGYGIIPKAVMIDTKLSPEAKCIYSYLCSYSGSEKKSYPGLKIMLYHLGMSEKRFYKYRKELIENGYIKVIQRRKKDESGKSYRDTNIYVLEQKITVYLEEDIDIEEDFQDSRFESVQNESVQNESVQNYRTNESNSNNINSNNINSNNINNIYAEIISYLNEKADTNYRPNAKKTKTHIDARLNEGYTLEDFKKVIDNKVSSWINTEMQKFLRPETLFGNKFEGYLNEKPFKKEPTTPKRTYTVNVPNKAKIEEDATYHDPKNYNNFEVSTDMQRLITDDDYAKDLENRLLGWD